ncbi:hypothetical protein CYG49_04170 [Candidatus Saccharibacteria bacterium]|nr:MAG: hypothetical protein CYG49_04170 [Candidatus Saccharibacteria bacterium]
MESSFDRSGRTRILLLGLLVIGAIFIIRLFWIQVIQHDRYEALALQNQETKFTIPAKRGLIYARDGKTVTPLVMNEPVYTVYADPTEVEEPEKIEALIRRVAGGNIRRSFETDLTNQKLRYTVLARQVNKTQAELIKREKLAGVGLQEGTRRVYPEGQLASQLLGFVNGEGEGQYGLEGMLDDRLKGTPGLLKAITDVRQVPLSINDDLVRVPAKNGDNLVLNIDRNVQTYAEKALKDGLERAKAKHGSVIVMEPTTGKVLAMANYPTYDPAKFSDVDDISVFQNSVVSAPYEAGSVIKTLTMGVGLDKGVVTPETTYQNNGSVQVGDFKISNATNDSIGTTNMVDVLHYSLNTGMVYVLKQLGNGSINLTAKQTLFDYFTTKYRFGQKTGIEQAGEQSGQVIGPKDAEGGEVRYANMTFGQGMDVTMVQAASAFSAAINGGTYYKPQLIGGTRSANGAIEEVAPHTIEDGIISPQASSTLRSMIVEARQSSAISKNDRKGYQIGGKTGTSQIIDPKTGKYTDENSIGTYLGFGGDNTPRYVIMVRVQDSKLPGYAGTAAAAPIFGDISNWMLDYLQVQPAR